MPVDVNYLTVLIAALVSLIIGFGWYSKSLFGPRWISLLGFTKEQQAKLSGAGLSGTVILTFIAELITALVLVIVIKWANATTLSSSLRVAVWLWLGFIASISLRTLLYERKSIQLYLINIGYRLFSLLIMSAIISVLST